MPRERSNNSMSSGTVNCWDSTTCFNGNPLRVDSKAGEMGQRWVTVESDISVLARGVRALRARAPGSRAHGSCDYGSCDQDALDQGRARFSPDRGRGTCAYPLIRLPPGPDFRKK